MRKAKIKDDNGKLIEIDIEKFKKHLDEYHSTGSSLHEENGHYFTAVSYTHLTLPTNDLV